MITDAWLPPVAVNTAVAFVLLGLGVFMASLTVANERMVGNHLESRMLTGFVATVLLMTIMAGQTYRNVTDYEQSAQLVEKTQAIRLNLGQLYSSVANTESEQRNYLLTGKTPYKTNYAASNARVDTQIANLKALVGDNPAESAAVANLQTLIVQRVAILDRHIYLYEHDGTEAAMAAFSSDDGTRVMQKIGQLSEAMENEELSLLGERSASLSRERRLTLLALFGLLMTNIVIMAFLFLAVRREMLARSRIENDLQTSVARLGAIFATAVDGIITIDEKGIIDTFNPAAERLFGYRADEVRGKNVRMLMPEPDRSRHDGYLARFRATREPRIIGSGREVIGQCKNGETFPMELAISEVLLGDRQSFTGIVHDITERKQAHEMLIDAKAKAERANQAKDSFLATMSHEIRTPLTGMLGMIEVLSFSPLDDNQQRTLNDAWNSGRSLLRIVSDVLDWSKIEAGKLSLAPQSVALPGVLQEVMNTYSRLASAKNLTLQLRMDDRVSTSHLVDPLRLSQILNNFVSNAIKFTQHGTVELSADLVKRTESLEFIKFSVTDTGKGISKEVQEHLFERYQQGGGDTARIYGGTGLGLSICRRLVELMDGRIEVTSEVEQGSTFSAIFSLPVTGSPEAYAVATFQGTERREVTPLYDDPADAPTVLVVDDHPINQELLARQLNVLGLGSEAAENGKVGLDMWKQGQFGLVITDCHMPEMDGYSLTRAIRRVEQERQGPRVPVIAWTANAVGDEMEHCHAAGMDEVLIKPANLRQLKRVLARCLLTGPVSDESWDAEVSIDNMAKQRGVIDYAALSLVEADPAQHLPVLHDFQAHLHLNLSGVADVLRQNDFVAVENAAHRLKGASRMVGAADIAAACERLEQAARESDVLTANDSLAALRVASAALEEHLAGTPNHD